MSNQLRCPECGRTYRIPEGFRKRSVVCKVCQARIEVKSPEPEVAGHGDGPAPELPDWSAALAQPVESSGDGREDQATPPTRAPRGPTRSERKRMTEEVTRLMAAIALADAEFPNASALPPVAPVPHNHLGHQLLFNYEKFARILWGTVQEIQSETPPNTFAAVLGLIAGAALSLGLLPLVGLWSLLVGVLTGSIVFGVLASNPNQLAADVRARNIRLLLKGTVPPSAASLRGQDWARWGDGCFDEDRCPVLIVYDNSDPFPGYGRLQARKVFVCRPSATEADPGRSPAAIQTTIATRLFHSVRDLGIQDITCGQVVLVHGPSLRKNSHWLDHEGRPLLYVGTDKLEVVEAVDPDASVRNYLAVQALLPRYLTSFTFFVRTFLAGNSAAAEVCVSTLGPPLRDWVYVRERLAAYEREKNAAARSRATPLKAGESKSALIARLREVRVRSEGDAYRFLAQRLPANISALNPVDPEEMQAISEEIEKIAENTSRWVGPFTTLNNWREMYSVTITEDFFGRSESLAITQTLYDRICRTILSTLEELGFDISDYKDQSGKFSINVDQIEQMIVGEQVFLSSRRGDKTAERRKPDADKRVERVAEQTGSGDEGKAA